MVIYGGGSTEVVKDAARWVIDDEGQLWLYSADGDHDDPLAAFSRGTWVAVKKVDPK